MCRAEKCCYFIPGNLGCMLVGICSFALSSLTLATSVAHLIIDSTDDVGEETTSPSYRLAESLGLSSNMSSIRIILTVVIIINALWMLFSILLIIGITKNVPSFLLSYFSFGIMITILCQLSALLVLLRNCWILSLILFLVSLLHIHFLVVVHTVYELMLQGKVFLLEQRQDDMDPLADCFDENIDSV